MKRIIPAFLLALILVLSFSAIKAADSVDDQGNPNDPAVNERANACYTGGTLAGKCDGELMWTGGWYLIRFEHGIISRKNFPVNYNWLLPEEVKVTTPHGAPAATCTISINGTSPILANSTITAPLDVIKGKTDPNGSFGATPYEFDWNGNQIWVYSGSTGIQIWTGSAWSGFVASATCPNPTAPV